MGFEVGAIERARIYNVAVKLITNGEARPVEVTDVAHQLLAWVEEAAGAAAEQRVADSHLRIDALEQTPTGLFAAAPSQVTATFVGNFLDAAKARYGFLAGKGSA